MKTSRLILAGLLFASGLAGAAETPLAKPLYIRGGFNGWGTEHALAYQGKGIYEADIVIGPGYHGFKVGSGDWSSEWVIDPAASVTVTPDTDYKLDTRAGPQDYLFVRSTASYRFRIDLTDPRQPRLRIARTATPAETPLDPHVGNPHTDQLSFTTLDDKEEVVHFSTPYLGARRRTYAQSSSMQQRDPGPNYVSYTEAADLPTVRSGVLAFDALFALAGAEMRQNAVSQISDGNYNGGQPVDCACFETGEKWHYVWTRDLSYAADLGLAMLDPQRVRNSLEFKLSGYRAGLAKAPAAAGSADGLQIIQDTGSGGSWPVSTDRVSWAFGAEAALNNLAPAERAAFAPRALKALVNTIENDRLAAFDDDSGLYTGEQSFLDWREQSYASWIVNDLASMASAKALSTNVAHYKALTLAASLAREQGDAAGATKYSGWAAALKLAINQRLWLEDAGMYSSLTAGHFDGAPLHKFDWLGQSLAIITGVASPARARSILAHYPHGPMGAPVIYPQQPGVPVYHNRAIWPFVTAYGLKAAAASGNVSVADAAYDSLMRGAALNLSNMENLEWLSGQPLLLDEKQPSLSGPVINSKRQLWSVGAYLGMVIEQVFGVNVEANGIRMQPFITSKLRRDMLEDSNRIVLNQLRLRGKRISVSMVLPPASNKNGYYPLQSLTLNGEPAKASIAWDQLPDESEIELRLGPLTAGEQDIRTVNADPYTEDPAVFAPREPAADAGAPGAGIRYHLYRDGKLMVANPRALTTPPAVGCYSIEAQFTGSGNRSHHSAPLCSGAAIEIGMADPRVKATVAPSAPDARLKAWGKPDDTVQVEGIDIAQAGVYAVQLRYHNEANQINLGISGGVKSLVLRDTTGRVVAQEVVQMPHAHSGKAGAAAALSTPLTARLAPGQYKLELRDFYNMSYLQSNSGFSAAGGVAGPSNLVDLVGVRILRIK